MAYKVPFFAVQSALYKVLSAADATLSWFDTGATIEEIEGFYKGRQTFAYGIMGAADADALPNKDTVVWNARLDLEIYSSYQGKKDVSERLEAIVNYLCAEAAWKAINEALEKEGFTLVSLSIGSLRINLPIIGDSGTWQSGATSLILRIGQKESD